MGMYCYQCEQTAQGTGCATVGVCGKTPETANLQDLLIEVTKGVAMYAHRARGLGVRDAAIDHVVEENLFTTVTNVNFDAERLTGLIKAAGECHEQARKLYVAAAEKACQPVDTLTGSAVMPVPATRADMEKLGTEVGILGRKSRFGDDIAGLMELLTYGLKGTAAYACHARLLGKESPEVYAFFHKALDLLTHDVQTVDELFAANMECGQINLKVMELLDAANNGTYGDPVPTQVRISARAGKCILVSGHDLKDLHDLLEQTEGLGINIYTHGEMLPANAYPELKKFKHLAGNYGGAWQDQAREFDAFPGAILMTTNCIQKPRETYQARLFTTGLVAWPGVTHVPNGHFGPVVAAALAAPGFPADEPEKTILIGYARRAVKAIAMKVFFAVKSGTIKHFFLIGGCDGAKPGRNYYTDFAQAAPKNTVIMTLACGKYRFNKLDFGEVGGIPRLLDLGQCNDAFSAIQIARAMSQVFGTEINSLPLSIILSWYEQKAVCILLTLLSLGLRNIRIGPSLPAFITPAVLNVLVEKFAIKPTTTAVDDLKAILPDAQISVAG